MCKVSDKLQLCTCKTQSVEQLKHYWVLKRPTRRKYSLFGEMILQSSLADAIEKFNESTILTQLNESNVFDIKMLHQDGDKLQLHFTLSAACDKHIIFPGDSNSLVYEFKFKKGVWKRSQYDPFKINFDEIQRGKIVRPFSKI